MIRALQRLRLKFPGHVFVPAVDACHFRRGLCSSDGGGKDSDGVKQGTGDKHKELDAADEFGMDEFVEDKEDDAGEVVLDDVDIPDDVTPELASDLVAKLVDATSRGLNESHLNRRNLLTAITPHTIEALRASRIRCNTVHAAGSDTFEHAIEKRVTAEINVDQLNMSPPALEALKILSGPRWKEDYISFSCDQYPTMEENRALLVTRIDRLIAEAKIAVGEAVDQTPLESWEKIETQVEKQAAKEIEEAGSLQLVLGEAKY